MKHFVLIGVLVLRQVTTISRHQKLRAVAQQVKIFDAELGPATSNSTV